MTAPQRNDDSACELRAGYVLAALSVEETEAFETHLAAGCKPCEKALAGDNAAVAALALSADDAEPSSDLKDRLLQRARETQSSDVAFHIVRKKQSRWRPMPFPGVAVRVLRVDRQRNRMMLLLRIAAGGRYPMHVHSDDEESYLIEGDLRTDSYELEPGDFLYAKAGSLHGELRSETGCVALISCGVKNEILA